MHIFENHEHKICTSIDKHHIHELELDCEIFHLQLKTPTIYLASNYDVIPQHFYTTIFIETPQQIEVKYHLKKTSRGPPYDFIFS